MTKKKIIGLCIGAVVLAVLRPVRRKALADEASPDAE